MIITLLVVLFRENLSCLKYVLFLACFFFVACETSDGVWEYVDEGADATVLFHATCGDGLCFGRETIQNCPGDCAGNTKPEPIVCGDAHCQDGETRQSCPADCVETCGNGLCLGGETALSCAPDCPAVCGDGACTGTEGSANCVEDCGTQCGDGFCGEAEDTVTCTLDCGTVCGDGLCAGPETQAICPQDCESKAVNCGDGTCEDGESSVSCVEDCGAICGDGVCNGPEDKNICAQDCGDPAPGEPCSGCLGAAESCAAACQGIGYSNGTCTFPGSNDPSACCECSNQNNPDPETTTARYVRVTTTESPSWVAWFEIQVLDANGTNIALGKTANASSSYEDQTPQNAIDGNNDTSWGAGDFPPATITIDLGQPMAINSVRMLVGQMPEGVTSHTLLFGDEAQQYTELKTFSGNTKNGDWLVYGASSGSGGNVPVDPEQVTWPPMEFNIIIRQTVQACGGCGIIFDWQGVQDNKPKLVIEYQHNAKTMTAVYQHGLSGMDNFFSFYISSTGEGEKHMMLIKKSPKRTGLLRVDLSDIPPDAIIVKATLYLHINTAEGFANGDNSSVLAVHTCDRAWDWDNANWQQYDNGLPWLQPGGDFSGFIRNIRAKEDMRDKGFSKANPNAFFDFTDHIQQLQSAR